MSSGFVSLTTPAGTEPGPPHSLSSNSTPPGLTPAVFAGSYLLPRFAFIPAMATPRARVSPAVTLTAAIEVFVAGFTFTRSLTHPYVGERVGPLWCLRDAPRQKPTDYRVEEWVSTGVPPAEVDQLARAHTRGRFALCVIVPSGEDERPTREAYRKLGYRLGRTEPLMVHNLKKIPRPTSPATLQRVRTAELAARVAAARGRRPLTADVLRRDAPLRLYAAEYAGEITGWVESIVCPAGTWCASMFVAPAHRRQGIASALLATMLRNDRATGAPGNVLLASHSGAKLYATLGYRQLGTLLLYTPKK